MTTAVVLQYKTFEEPLTLARKVEVRAIDLETHQRVVALSPREMAKWLQEMKFTRQPGSSGIWRGAA